MLASGTQTSTVVFTAEGLGWIPRGVCNYLPVSSFHRPPVGLPMQFETWITDDRQTIYITIYDTSVYYGLISRGDTQSHPTPTPSNINFFALEIAS